MFLIFECPIQILFPKSFCISSKVLLGTSAWINSDNLLPCMNRSTATKVIAHTVPRCNIYLIFSQLSNSVQCSNVRYLEHDQVCIFLSGRAMDWSLFNRSSKAFVKNTDPVRRTSWKFCWFIALVICCLKSGVFVFVCIDLTLTMIDMYHSQNRTIQLCATGLGWAFSGYSAMGYQVLTWKAWIGIKLISVLSKNLKG